MKKSVIAKFAAAGFALAAAFGAVAATETIAPTDTVEDAKDSSYQSSSTGMSGTNGYRWR